MTAAPTRDDAMTLIGHAEYLRKCHGEEDMPRFFDALAQKILPRARETDGAVREAAAKLNATGEEMARLDENNVADSFAALHVLAPRFIREAKALLSALSPTPRPATKDDDKGGAA